MTTIRNLNSNGNHTGICGAASLVGKEGYAVKIVSDLVVLADNNSNAVGAPQVAVLVRGGGVGETVEYAITPGTGVAVVVADASAAVDAHMMVDSAGKFTALTGAGKYSSVILREAVTAAGQIVEAMIVNKPGVGA
jgi:hypothetical protein